MPGILVIRGGAIGDFVLTLPVLRLLRGNFPGQQVEILGTPGIAELATHFGLADAVRRLEDPALARFFVPGAALDEGWSRYFASFSVIVSYLYDPDDFFHGNLRRAGAATILRGPHRPAEGSPHAARQLASPLEQLAVFWDEGAEQNQAEAPAGKKEATAKPLIALHPGSGSARKNWPLENWLEVAARLSRESGASFLVLGGDAEDGTINGFLETLTARGISFQISRHEPLPRLAEKLAACDLFLGHDTGPAHLAAFCGVPCVLVFRATNPAVWAPPGRHVRVLCDDPCATPPLTAEIVAAEAARLFLRPRE